MKKTWTYFVLPIYWPVWLLVGCVYLVSILPFRWQVSLGKKLGGLIYRFSKRARHIAIVNINLCFPNLTQKEKDKILFESFQNIGVSMIETCVSFLGSNRQLRNLVHYHGREHLDQGIASNKGVLLLGAHFTTIYMIGRLCSLDYDFGVMYRPHKIGILNYIIKRALEKHHYRAIPRQDIRTMIKTLQEGKVVWYSADVNAKPHQSVFAPFFGIQAATTKAPMRFVEMSQCVVLPMSHFRRDDNTGYDIHIGAPLENFPSGDYVADATRINKIIEQEVRKNPSQYLWQYMRFKTRPNGEKRFYSKKKIPHVRSE